MGTLSDSGYVADTKEDVKEDIYAAWRAKPALGTTFLSNPDTPQAQLSDPIAEALADVDALIAALFTQRSLSTATGQFLDDLGEAQGILRQTPTRSVVTATVNLSAGVTLPAGSRASAASDPDAIYEIVTDVTNTTGVAADFTVQMQAVEPGSGTFVSIGDLTVIETPTTGWNSVINAADSSVGTDQETDTDYRARIKASQAIGGSVSVDAIRADLLNVAGVSSVRVLNNRGLRTDSNGVPPKSVEAIVTGGAANDLAQILWEVVAPTSGIAGNTSGTATDSLGNTYTIAFSRPVATAVTVAITLLTDTSFPGAATFEQAFIAAFTAAFPAGTDVSYTKLYQFAYSVAGVLDVTALTLNGGTSNIVIAPRQVATLSTTDLVTTVT